MSPTFPLLGPHKTQLQALNQEMQLSQFTEPSRDQHGRQRSFRGTARDVFSRPFLFCLAHLPGRSVLVIRLPNPVVCVLTFVTEIHTVTQPFLLW